jgi:hypothetical protein
MSNSFSEQNRRSLDELRELVQGLTDEQLQTKIDDDWTIAAVLAHIAFWDRRAAKSIDRLRADKEFKPGVDDAHVVNNSLLSVWSRLAPRDALAEFIEAGEESNAKTDSLSEQEAQQYLEYQSFNIDRSDHRDEHLQELKRVFA